MNQTEKLGAVITLDHYSPDLQTDLLDPLLATPGVQKIVLRVPSPSRSSADRVTVESSLEDERSSLLRLAEQQGTATLLRIALSGSAAISAVALTHQPVASRCGQQDAGGVSPTRSSGFALSVPPGGSAGKSVS